MRDITVYCSASRRGSCSRNWPSGFVIMGIQNLNDSKETMTTMETLCGLLDVELP